MVQAKDWAQPNCQKPHSPNVWGFTPPQVDRLLDFSHASKLDSLEDGLAAVGKLLTVDVKAA